MLPFIDLGLWKVLVQEFGYNILPINQTILREGIQPNLSIPRQREGEKTQSDGFIWHLVDLHCVTNLQEGSQMCVQILM